MEKESQPQYVVEEMQLEDIEAATAMRLKSWLDTYPNDELGISREWVEQRNAVQRSDVKIESRRQRFIDGRAGGTFNAWVAKDAGGHIIGSTTPYIDKDGTRHVGSLYVDKEWHGIGIAHQLMQRAIDWLDGDHYDIELGVVSYNERAKAFYRKWGFVEEPGSEMMFDDKIPEVKMIRKGDNDEV